MHVLHDGVKLPQRPRSAPKENQSLKLWCRLFLKKKSRVCDFCAIVFDLMCVELAEGHEGIVKSKQISDPKMVA